MDIEQRRRVSVVVPVYGAEEFVAPCVESILEQSHRNLEIILVNDGSPDASGRICDFYAARDRRIKVLHQGNSGLVHSRQRGVAMATGEFLVFVDGDDWLGEQHVAEMFELIATSGADLAVSGYVREFMGSIQRVDPRIEEGVYDRRAIVEAVIPTALYNGNFIQHGISTYLWNKIFRRTLVKPLVDSVPRRIVMGEDAAITYPYLGTCSRLAVTKSGDYFYRQRPRSILKSLDSTDVELRRICTLAQYLKARFLETTETHPLAHQLAFYVYSLILARTGGIIQADEKGRWYSPFKLLQPGRRVVVWSSGSLGQHLMSAITAVGDVEVVGWLDDDANESRHIGLPVADPASIQQLRFDAVLVASLDPQYNATVRDRLQSLGVDAAKVSFLEPDFVELREVLAEIGFDMDSYSYKPRHERAFTSE